MSRSSSSSPQPPADARAASSSPDATGRTWTTRRLLAWMADAFRDKGLDAPRMLAEQLLAHTLGCERIRLYTDPDRPTSDDERARLRDLAARALRHEPVQYLVGEAWFYSLPLIVDRRVLIPRPSTATLADAALAFLRSLPRPPLLADVGTGCGAIAIAILKNHPDARAIATDISPDALDVARANAQRHAVADRLELRLGSLTDPLADAGPFDAILANPPYVPDHEWPDVEPNVAEHEPPLALRAGPDGLDLIRPLLAAAPGLLRPGGFLGVEIASCTREAVLDLARADARLTDADVLDDLDRLPRVLVAHRT